MITTKIKKTPGRPRHFEVDSVIPKAQALFHQYGYDDLSVADLTKAFGINPPSFYAAFGNKMGLYKRVLNRYSTEDGIPLHTLLTPEQSVAACLEALLNDAAQRYAAEPERAGCIVLEGTHCLDEEARNVAMQLHISAEEYIRDFIADFYPDDAQQITDYISTFLLGMSAKARQGYSLERLQQMVNIVVQELYRKYG